MKPAVVFIVYIIFTLLKNIKDNETTAANISQLHTHLQCNFYWLFIIQLHFTKNKLNK